MSSQFTTLLLDKVRGNHPYELHCYTKDRTTFIIYGRNQGLVSEEVHDWLRSISFSSLKERQVISCSYNEENSSLDIVFAPIKTAEQYETLYWQLIHEKEIQRALKVMEEMKLHFEPSLNMQCDAFMYSNY